MEVISGVYHTVLSVFLCLQLFSKKKVLANKTPIMKGFYWPKAELETHGDCSEEMGVPWMLKVSINCRLLRWANGHVACPTAKPLLPGLQSPNSVQVPVIWISSIFWKLVSFEVEMSRSVRRVIGGGVGGFGEIILLDKNCEAYSPSWVGEGLRLGEGMVRGTLAMFSFLVITWMFVLL